MVRIIKNGMADRSGWEHGGAALCFLNTYLMFSTFFLMTIFLLSPNFSTYSEALHAWRAKARCNIVPAERLHELFEELKFSPTEKQSELTLISAQYEIHICFFCLFLSLTHCSK